LTELNIVNHHSNYYILILVLSMANQERDEDWNKKRQQAQPFINKIRSCMEKKARWIEEPIRVATYLFPYYWGSWEFF